MGLWVDNSQDSETMKEEYELKSVVIYVPSSLTFPVLISFGLSSPYRAKTIILQCCGWHHLLMVVPIDPLVEEVDYYYPFFSPCARHNGLHPSVTCPVCNLCFRNLVVVMDI